ncbi:MAG: ABC transporter substrate-binding protein, partial [Acidimicrobiales bacterium]|nr:ABC transporter substrate-binding protein [Acidimicrobiales bacterium]
GLEIVETQLHDQAADAITNEITTLAASGADAIVLGTTGAFCPQAMGTIAANEWSPIGLVSSTCSIIELLWAPLGDAANGFRIALTPKDVSDPSLQDDPAVIETRTILSDAGFEPTEGSLATGVLFGRNVEALLNRAIELGGLNRSNLIAAMWSLDFDNPGLYDGVTGQTSGADDAYLLENALIAEYLHADEGGSFVPITDVFVAEGTNGSFGG